MRKIMSIVVCMPLLMILLAACGDVEPAPSSSGSNVECSQAADCGTETACKKWRCEVNHCVADFAPAGTLGSSEYQAPPCKRIVCDGQGDEILEIDTSNSPPDMAGDCQRFVCNADGTTSPMVDTTDVVETPADCKKNACDATGHIVQSPDPTDIPADIPKDCKKNSCDANGAGIKIPDPADVPDNESGDCVQLSCDANGNTVEAPANDPPPATMCATYGCQNGEAIVSMVMNQGLVCSPYGYSCGSTGECDTCPAADAMCTAIGPGVGTGSKASAYDFGEVGWCDFFNDADFCGRVGPGATSYFRYIADGSFSLCQFDPYVSATASDPVKLCEYFNCPSVTCPSGSTPATLDGFPGCCRTDTVPTMVISPSCRDSEVFMTIENMGSTCVAYEMHFHT